LPDQARHYALLAIIRMLACAEAHRALIAAGAEAAVQAMLAAGPAAPQLGDAAAPPPGAAGPDARTAAWPDVVRAASEVLEDLREPPPADARPAADADASKCAVCGKRAAAMPGGRPLMRCSGCRGPERWCSKECQRASWLGGHREVCRQRQAAAAASAAAPDGT
jgi:hypothetical protein